MLETAIILGYLVPILILIFSLACLYKGIKIVPQSEVYVVERFGKYTKTLKAGLNLLIPFLDKVEHIREMIGTNAIMPAFSYGGMSYLDAEASLKLFAERCLPEINSWEVEPLLLPDRLAA